MGEDIFMCKSDNLQTWYFDNVKVKQNEIVKNVISALNDKRKKLFDLIVNAQNDVKKEEYINAFNQETNLLKYVLERQIETAIDEFLNYSNDKKIINIKRDLFNIKKLKDIISGCGFRAWEEFLYKRKNSDTFIGLDRILDKMILKQQCTNLIYLITNFKYSESKKKYRLKLGGVEFITKENDEITRYYLLQILDYYKQHEDNLKYKIIDHLIENNYIEINDEAKKFGLLKNIFVKEIEVISLSKCIVKFRDETNKKIAISMEVGRIFKDIKIV
jgi:hypothetical protein